MTNFPKDFSIYVIVKDSLWTISIIVAVISNIINIRKNSELKKQKRLLEKENNEYGICSKKEYEELKMFYNKKEKILPKKIFNIIMEINNGFPEIFYDKGYFYKGWNWYKNNSVVIIIEKHYFVIISEFGK